jgi:hypothetical protein
MQTFYGEELKARRTIPKLVDSPVATYRDWFLQYKPIHSYHPYLEAGSIRNMMHIAVVALLVTTSSF